MINQTDLKYFLELSTTLHLTRSAERLGVSQPALSHCLKRIEAEIGTALFIRSKKGIQLTHAGIQLKSSVSDLLIKWDEIKTSALNETTQVRGQIKIGVHASVAQYTLPHFLGGLLKKFTEIEIQLSHGLSRHMTEQVVSNRLDVAIAVNPVSNLDLIIKEICKDQVCVWRSQKNLNPDVLFLEPSLLQTQEILQKLRAAKISFKRLIETTSLELIAKMIDQGVGSGILPERVLKSQSHERVEKYPGTPTFNDRICLVYKKEFRHLARGRAFIDAVLRGQLSTHPV